MAWALKNSLESLFLAPKRYRADARTLAERAKRVRKLGPLRKLKDIPGEAVHWSDRISFEAKPNSPELRRIMAAFGGIWNKEFDKYTGTFDVKRSEPYEGFAIVINVVPGANCQVEMKEVEETYKRKLYTIVPGSCDPITGLDNATVDSEAVA